LIFIGQQWKKIKFLLPLLFAITIACNGQVNTLAINDLTINNVIVRGKDKSVLSQNFGEPIAIEQVYFEMQEKMAYKHTYNGVLFYILDDIIESFEISSSNFSFSTHNIRIGNTINTLESIYPASYLNKGVDFLSFNIEGYDYFITILFNKKTQLIQNIYMGSY